jgi:hypothetical protein
LKVLDILKVLASGQAEECKQEFNGKRIKAVEDGWMILNGQNAGYGQRRDAQGKA